MLVVGVLFCVLVDIVVLVVDFGLFVAALVTIAVVVVVCGVVKW